MTKISDMMFAVGLREADGQLMLRQIPVPVPGKGEVLVKMAAAPINPSDLARIRSITSPEDRQSFIAGIEGSGLVVAAGKGLIAGIWLGKRVACSSIHSSSGSWAEYMVASALGCVPLPAKITNEQGSMMLVNPLTAVAFFNIIRQHGHKAVINTAAASSLGMIIDLLGRKNHVAVVHIVHNEKQKNTLKARGAGYVLDSSDPGFFEDLKTYAVQLDATLVFDAVGGDLTRQLIMAVPYGSSVIIYGNLSGEQPEIDHKSLVGDNKSVSGFYLVNWLKQQNMATKIRTILQARRLLQDEISIPVQAVFPLDQVQKAVETYLGNMSGGKVLLIPDSERNQ